MRAEDVVTYNQFFHWEINHCPPNPKPTADMELWKKFHNFVQVNHPSET